ncbi:hypothetical protein TNCV_249821 [Trichonephila clavipes]|nr:hypothetical protein TNCV_249821 [Trichonephila clavipes]
MKLSSSLSYSKRNPGGNLSSIRLSFPTIPASDYRFSRQNLSEQSSEFSRVTSYLVKVHHDASSNVRARTTSDRNIGVVQGRKLPTWTGISMPLLFLPV